MPRPCSSATSMHLPGTGFRALSLKPQSATMIPGELNSGVRGSCCGASFDAMKWCGLKQVETATSYWTQSTSVETRRPSVEHRWTFQVTSFTAGREGFSGRGRSRPAGREDARSSKHDAWGHVLTTGFPGVPAAAPRRRVRRSSGTRSPGRAATATRCCGRRPRCVARAPWDSPPGRASRSTSPR